MRVGITGDGTAGFTTIGADQPRANVADSAPMGQAARRVGYASKEGSAMDEDGFNMSIRKFLKVVGVTSQREIETAVREAVKQGRLKGDERLEAKVMLTLSGVGLSLAIDGEIELG
jgi:3-oxoacyl-[acyl-carrier-protein] synthase III